MKTRSLVLAGLAIAVFLIAAGCAGYPEYLNRSLKVKLRAGTSTQYTATKYEILGPVEAKGRSFTVLGVYVEGKEGEALLWAEARKKYGDKVNGIKDICAISDYKGILPPVFCEIFTTYMGIAVHEK